MMKVLLTETINKIGIVGEVVNVSEGFARNYLLPKKLAITPTEGNIKRYEQQKTDYERKLRELRSQKEALLAQLTGVEITIARAANEDGHLFGSVSRRDIAEELQKQGFALTHEDIRLDDSLRRVDTFMVPVQLAGDLKTEIKVWVVRDKESLVAEAVTKPSSDSSEAPAAE